MKIKEIRIGGFGKHNDKHYKFEDDINVLYGENESGKTTILSFIRAMFYGMDTRSQKISENYRKHYTPWNQTTMTGEIVFENLGQPYVLKRIFGASKRTDIIQMNNNITGEVIPIQSDLEVGEAILGIGYGAFESSIFIPQLCTIVNSAKDKNGELISKLTALSGNGNEEVSLQDIESRLSDAINFLKAPRGVKGVIDKLIIKKTELITELQVLEQSGLKAAQMRESLGKMSLDKALLLDKLNDINRRKMLWTSSDILQHRSKILDIRIQLDDIDAKLAVLFDKAQYMNYSYVSNCRDILTQLTNNKRDVENCLSSINDCSIRISSLSSTLSGLSDVLKVDMELLDSLSVQIKSTQSEIEQVIKLETEKDDATIKLNEIKLNKSPESAPKTIPLASLVCLILSFSFMSLGFFMFFRLASVFIGIGSLTIGFIFLFIAIYNLINRGKERKYKINEQQNILSSTIKALDLQLANRTSEDLTMLLESLNNKKSGILLLANCQTYDVLVAKRLDAANLTSRLSEAVATKKPIQMKYDMAYTNVVKLQKQLSILIKQSLDNNVPIIHNDAKLLLDQLEQQVRNYTYLCQQKEQLITLLTQTVGDNSPETLEAMWQNAECELDKAGVQGFDWEGILPDELKISSDSLELSLNSISNEILSMSSKLDALYEGSTLPESITSELDEVNTSIKQYSRLSEVYNLAKENISIAFDELQKSFGPILNLEAANIFKALTGERYNDLKISRNFDITILQPDNSMLYDSTFFSGGTVDQVYLAFRLAISRIIAPENEPFPIFLDEVFTQYDDSRLENACKFLIDFTKTCNCQLILSTCQKRVVDALIAVKANIYVISLNN